MNIGSTEDTEMIKPEFVKILTHDTSNGTHRIWFILNGKGGKALNGKNKRLIPEMSTLVSDENMGGFNRVGKEIEKLCKNSYRFWK